MKRLIILFTLSFLLLSISQKVQAQATRNLVYIDKEGRLRWEKDKTEVYIFGVNYTVPFAYGYRSMKAMNKSVEQEIDEDTYHMARIGVDGFRVHIWDTEISDSAGNLLQNEHLKLFDYLLYRLKQRNIKIIITIEAFYGDGYPQKDEKSNGFSAKYGKENAGLNEIEIKAQENYIKQLLQHTNPYTKLNYRDEPDIIAAELNNEPAHSGPHAAVTAYINRLEAAARSTGWSKPLFYNISQNPSYADAVAKSNVNGFSFQWYPTGLVEGHEQKGNFLPNVDKYHIPFDTIPEFKNKARMVYEFDAADVLQSCIYPAVARSFKQAGFQWVTQFAYDPMGSAYANTEYQTHYLNLAYTPPKAISYLIASRAFHIMPRDKDYGAYPTDSVFDAYHVSYSGNRSEMNTANEFYYSGSTSTTPLSVTKLQHIAGVGSSPIVNYKGYGAYFMDKLENGIWRLEVMPDAITVRDPFSKPSPQREVVHIQWADEPMQIALADIGDDFDIKAVNVNNTYAATAANGSFNIKPGTYLLVKKGKSASKWTADKMVGQLGLNEFVAPQPFSKDTYVRHIPPVEISANQSFSVKAKIINVNPDAKVTLVVNRLFGRPEFIPMEKTTPYDFSAEIPAAQIVSGILTYRILIQQGNKYISFPGSHEGDPAAWDYTNTDSWQTFIAAPRGNLSLFNAAADKENANVFFMGSGRNGGAQYVSGEQTGQLAFKASTQSIRKNQEMGFQLYIGDKIKDRLPEVATYSKVIVRARMQNGQTGKLRIALVSSTASSYAAYIDLGDQYKDVEIPLSAFKPDSSLSLPRPYPGFQALWFKAGSFSDLSVSKLDKLEVTSVNDLGVADLNKPYGIEVESVLLEH
jgi:hypothetical protein